MRNPKNIETELNRQPDKYRYRSRYQHRLDFFQGCNPDRPLYRGVLCPGAGIKWSNRHRLGFSQGGNPARPLYRGVLCPGAGIKRSTNINCVFSGVTRTGHFIERVWGLGHCTRCQVTLCGVLGSRRLQFPCGFMLALYVGTTVRFHFGSTMAFHFISILVFLSKWSVHECPNYSPEKK